VSVIVDFIVRVEQPGSMSHLRHAIFNLDGAQREVDHKTQIEEDCVARVQNRAGVVIALT
jgi:hypothetical protein